MKNRSFKDIVMIVCAGLLIAAFGIVLLRAGTKTILVDKLHKGNSFVKIVLSDNPDLMKFEKVKAPASISANKNFFQKVSDIQEKVKKQKSDIDAWTNTNFYKYMNLVYLANAYDERIGWNIPLINGYNTSVKLHDGQLAHFNGKHNTTRLSKSVIDFANYCKKQNIKFLMVLAPGKISRADKAFYGTLDFSNQNGDQFLKQLRKAHINCLDLREFIEKEGLNQHDLFYRTDHHWKASTGRWAAQRVLGELNKHYGYHADLSLLNPQKYKEKNYDALYLGSRGKKVTTARTTPDDFTIFLPKFKTRFQFTLPNGKVKKEGDFSVLYNLNKLKRNKYGYSLEAYQAYGWGDKDLVVVRNMRKKDHKKVLLIRDSFSDAFIPFASLGMEHLTAIDLRHYTKSLKEYIKKDKTDTIIILYWIQELNRDYIAMKKHTDLFDFR